MGASYDFNVFTGSFDLVTDLPDLSTYAKWTPTALADNATFTVPADAQVVATPILLGYGAVIDIKLDGLLVTLGAA